METTTQLKHTKPGEYVRRKSGAKTTWKRGDYDRKTRSYSLQDCEDMNREISLKAGTIVLVGFAY